MKLSFSSLSLSLVVILASHKKEFIIHHQWLALLCTSLINHTCNYNSKTVQKIDRILCHINTTYLTYRMLIKKFTFLTGINAILGAYILYIYHLTDLCEKYVNYHISLHVVSTIIAINTMFIK